MYLVGGIEKCLHHALPPVMSIKTQANPTSAHQTNNSISTFDLDLRKKPPVKNKKI